MEEKDLLSRIEKLEKRVASLEKELSVIAQINQSEKVKEYIASAEKSRKIAMLLDMSSQKEDSLDDKVEQAIDEHLTCTVSNRSSVNGLTKAKEYVIQIETGIVQEIDKHSKLINQYDWESIFEYSINDGNIKIDNYIGFDDIKTIIIPEKINGYTVTEIGDSVFKNCKNIIEIVLPDTIVNIGREAFAESGLVKINLVEGIKNIGERAFYGTSIFDIYIPKSLLGIPRQAFAFCKIEQIYFGEGITFIAEYAFNSCRKLKKIDIPNSVKEIGIAAFGNIIETRRNVVDDKFIDIAINNLNIRIPDSVEKIAGYSKSGIHILGSANVGICIYCNQGSMAMKFAREHGIQVKRYEEFELLEE